MKKIVFSISMLAIILIAFSFGSMSFGSSTEEILVGKQENGKNLITAENAELVRCFQQFPI